MRMRWRNALILGLFLSACGRPALPNTPTPPAMPVIEPTPLPVTMTPTLATPPKSFRVIGYVTDAVVPSQVHYDELTHMNFAFLIPNADGTFQPLLNSWKIKELIQRAHAQNVRVLISVGGWGWDAQFESMAADAQKRAAFVSNLLAVVDEYGFDGADIDWEYPDPGASARNYLALMTELRAALPGKLLTTAVIAYGDETGLGIPAETFALLDYVNVMAYDDTDHGAMPQFTKALDYWLGRGLPKEKLCMGVPFYSRPGEVLYRSLVAADPAAAQTDTFKYNGVLQKYNGLPTIREKTHLALERAAGIMIWTVEYDAPGDASLLAAINETIASYKP